jgi:D-alanine-D-alanine ligase
VYNQKKEGPPPQSGDENASDQPGVRGHTVHPLIQRVEHHPIVNPAADRYAEWDTFETIDAVRSSLAEFHDVTLIEADTRVFARLLDQRPDIVFNIAEGLYGMSREAQIPAILEMLQIPYAGSDPLTLGICLDKSRAKEILSYYNIPTPSFAVIRTREEIDGVAVRFPAIVKPLHEGSSKGIFNSSLVANRFEMARQVTHVLDNYEEPAIVEEYLPGREFTVAVLGNGGETRILPVIEIRFDSLPSGVNPIYSYEAKWIWDRSDNPLDIFDCPARIPEQLRSEIESVCLKAYSVLRCRDWSRIDIRLDADGRAHIIEINPLPGILPNPRDNSCFPKAARAAGMNYARMIQTVLDCAIRRYRLAPQASPVRSLSS